MLIPRAQHLVVACAAAAVLFAPTSCSDSRDAGPNPSAPPGADPPAVGALLQRLRSVQGTDVAMGESFNREMLRLGFRALGFDETEAGCSADAVADARGDAIASATVSELFDADSLRPESLLSCVSPARVSELGSAEGIGTVPPDVAEELRGLLGLLAAAGWETVGLTPGEASCLAEETSAVDDGAASDLRGLGALVPGAAPRPVTAAMVERCITPERITQLAR